MDKSEIAKIRELTDKAIEEGYDAANAEWRAMALEQVYRVALRKEEFTANDVRDLVENSPLKTHDKRAMGGVMKTAQKMGWIHPSGRSIPSKVGHLVPILIWESKIFDVNEVKMASAADAGIDYEVRETLSGILFCTCIGFRYRRKCRHVEEVAAKRAIQPKML